MKLVAFMVLLTLASPASAQVFRFGEPKGIAMWSMESHKPSPDGYKGVKPVVIIEDKQMTIVWGDSQSAGGTEKAWKAVIINRNANSISAVSLDSGDLGSAVMLYTIDIKRGFLYMSTHKENELFNGSGASTFVSALEH